MRTSTALRAALVVVTLTALFAWATAAEYRIARAHRPTPAMERRALACLEALRTGGSCAVPPDDPPLAGRLVITAWSRGRPLASRDGGGKLIATVERATRALLSDPAVRGAPNLASHAPDRVRLTATLSLGEGPLLLGVPYVSAFSLVPLREGLVASLGERRVHLTPDMITSQGAYEAGLATPLPDLTVGLDVDALADRLARDLGVELDVLLERGTLRRFAAYTLGDASTSNDEVTAPSLAAAAREGARFLLRHQRSDGTFTYVYDAHTGRARPDPYNLPRHAGTAYFLALVDRVLGDPASRAGAQRALAYLSASRLRTCGGPDRGCIESDGRVEVGSSALALIAAAEVLEGGEDPVARRLVSSLAAFLRAQQRPDGELMHEWDLARNEPVDVQHLYYSGEAAFALFRAHDVLADPRDLEAGRRLMRHLTGAGWDFFGSRYYYGEEHWTCIAADAAGDRMSAQDARAALDFCLRWAAWNREIQFRPGQTPWRVAGAYGVGPIVVPRITPVASRTEAFISTDGLVRRMTGREDPSLRRQIEAGLGMLLRSQFRPGPAHLFADPAGARGGVPGSPTDLLIRNDFVQHAASAMVRWAARLGVRPGTE